jgi:inorganic pyrophosphatase
MTERGSFPDLVEIVVEIPRGSRNKIEWDERAAVFRLDRVLSSAVTGCHVWARPVGVLEMRDDKGEDFKIFCVAEVVGWRDRARAHEILSHDRAAWTRERRSGE